MSDPHHVDAVEAGLSQWGENASSLLQILIHIQQRLGHIPDSAVELLSHRLGIEPSVIDGVVSLLESLK